jgi:hypothetical protein
LKNIGRYFPERGIGTHNQQNQTPPTRVHAAGWAMVKKLLALLPNQTSTYLGYDLGAGDTKCA